jgi:hypothetical protein
MMARNRKPMVRKASTKLRRLDHLIQEAHRNGRRWSGWAAALEYASRKLFRSLDSDSTPSVSHSRYVPRVPIDRGLHDLPAMRLIREITDQLRMVHGVGDIDDHVDGGCTVAVVSGRSQQNRSSENLRSCAPT